MRRLLVVAVLALASCDTYVTVQVEWPDGGSGSLGDATAIDARPPPSDATRPDATPMPDAAPPPHTCGDLGQPCCPNPAPTGCYFVGTGGCCFGSVGSIPALPGYTAPNVQCFGTAPEQRCLHCGGLGEHYCKGEPDCEATLSCAFQSPVPPINPFCAKIGG